MEINYWICNILKIPAIYFFCGIMSPDIKMKQLLYILLTIILLSLINLIGGSFEVVGKEIIGYLIGAGILGLILFGMHRTKIKNHFTLE
jgi:hypothetical protein